MSWHGVNRTRQTRLAVGAQHMSLASLSTKAHPQASLRRAQMCQMPPHAALYAQPRHTAPAGRTTTTSRHQNVNCVRVLSYLVMAAIKMLFQVLYHQHRLNRLPHRLQHRHPRRYHRHRHRHLPLPSRNQIFYFCSLINGASTGRGGSHYPAHR